MEWITRAADKAGVVGTVVSAAACPACFSALRHEPLRNRPGAHMTHGEVSSSGVILSSVLTCPHCSYTKREDMPVDACQFFYECGNCKALLRPKPGDCCVFCSFGSVKCPPIQVQRQCCGDGVAALPAVATSLT